MVDFISHVNHSEMSVLYCAADLLVMVSFKEAWGMVFIEAMACGKPVIGTRIPALQDTVTNEAGILVPPADSVALADAIEYMLDHHRSYSPQKIAAYAHGRFGYEAVGEALSQVYHEVLNA